MIEDLKHALTEATQTETSLTPEAKQELSELITEACVDLQLVEIWQQRRFIAFADALLDLVQARILDRLSAQAADHARFKV